MYSVTGPQGARTNREYFARAGRAKYSCGSCIFRAARGNPCSTAYGGSWRGRERRPDAQQNEEPAKRTERSGASIAAPKEAAGIWALWAASVHNLTPERTDAAHLPFESGRPTGGPQSERSAPDGGSTTKCSRASAPPQRCRVPRGAPLPPRQGKLRLAVQAATKLRGHAPGAGVSGVSRDAGTEKATVMPRKKTVVAKRHRWGARRSPSGETPAMGLLGLGDEILPTECCVEVRNRVRRAEEQVEECSGRGNSAACSGRDPVRRRVLAGARYTGRAAVAAPGLGRWWRVWWCGGGRAREHFPAWARCRPGMGAPARPAIRLARRARRSWARDGFSRKLKTEGMLDHPTHL